MEDLEQILEEVFCNRAFDYKGQVEFTKSRIDQDITDVLRKVSQEENFEIITYEGGILAFYVLADNFTIVAKTARVPITLVFISNRYADHERLIAKLDRYEYDDIEVSLNSQLIYNKYFVEDVNKPFQGFAFELRFNVPFTFF